jgi:hypothetical protein
MKQNNKTIQQSPKQYNKALLSKLVIFFGDASAVLHSSQPSFVICVSMTWNIFSKLLFLSA